MTPWWLKVTASYSHLFVLAHPAAPCCRSYLRPIYSEEDNAELWAVTQNISVAILLPRMSSFFTIQSVKLIPPSSAKLLHVDLFKSKCWSRCVRILFVRKRVSYCIFYFLKRVNTKQGLGTPSEKRVKTEMRAVVIGCCLCWVFFFYYWWKSSQRSKFASDITSLHRKYILRVWMQEQKYLCVGNSL